MQRTLGVSRLLAIASLIATIDSALAQPFADKWSASVFIGPTTTKFFSQIFLDGDYAASGAAFGINADRRLAYLGWGFTLVAEGLVTQGIAGRADTTASLGLGLEFTGFPWQARWPTSFSFFTGPSYSFDPPSLGGPEGNEQFFQRRHLLNYVGIEFAAALSRAGKWDGIFRIFHRSGVFGLYSKDADEGTMMGLGIRHRF
jgi:hypothetical protein